MENERHDHEYMHAHNIPHDHDHAHDHAHCPSDGAHCHAGCAGCSGDPKAELAALMKYMVNHNAANELAGLAGKLKEMGDNTGYEQVMAAVSDFEKGNMRLSAVLAAMNVPQK